jgi:hypothetical protein
MSINNIILSPFTVKKLYQTGLVVENNNKNNQSDFLPAKDNEIENVEKKITNPTNNGNLMKHLGKNNRHILILVNRETHAFLDDDSLSFLMNILNACSISMQDVALVNVHNNADAVFQKLIEQFTPKYILFFDTAPHLLDFPVQIPSYKIQVYNNQQYLCATSLSNLERNKDEKKQLWLCLKTMFNI